MLLPISALLVAAGASAEPHRAEELEQLRIQTGYIIEAGESEMNLVPSHFDYDDAQRRQVEMELEHALSERLMVEVEIPYHWVDFDGSDESVDGRGNIEVGAKWLMTERGNLSASIRVGVELPAGSERPEVATDVWGTELSIPLSVRFPESHTSLHVEPGVEWAEHAGFEEQFLNLAFERRPADSNLTLQVGTNIARENDDVEAYLVPAFEVAASTIAFQFGMGVPVGLTSDSADWGLVFDFEVEF